MMENKCQLSFSGLSELNPYCRSDDKCLTLSIYYDMSVTRCYLLESVLSNWLRFGKVNSWNEAPFASAIEFQSGKQTMSFRVWLQLSACSSIRRSKLQSVTSYSQAESYQIQYDIRIKGGNDYKYSLPSSRQLQTSYMESCERFYTVGNREVVY